MKKTSTLLMLALLLGMFSLAAPALLAQASLSVQGVLSKSDGTAVDDGDYSMTFKLWTTQTGGTAVHTESIQEVETIGGVYSVVLGRNGTPLTAPFDQLYYLGVSVGGGQELLPRPLLTHAPYALSLLGERNRFPSTGLVQVEAINTPGTATAQTLDVTGIAKLPVLNLTGKLSAAAFVGTSGAPALVTAGKGYSFGAGGDQDGGLFSTADGTVSIYANANECIRVTDSHIKFGGAVQTITGFAFDDGLFTSGLFDFLNNYEIYLRYKGADRIGLLSTATEYNGLSVFQGTANFDGDIESSNDYIEINKPVDIISEGRTYSNVDLDNDVYRKYFDNGENHYDVSDGDQTFDDVSLIVNGAILSEDDGFYAVSDRRIKKDFSRVNQAESLAQLCRLQVTDYRYMDEIEKGRGLHKGFIAQEVEAIAPAAITKGAGFIPNVYAPASNIETVDQQFVFSLAAPHGLQKGDKVRILDDAGWHEPTVDAVTETGFAVAPWGQTAPGKAFVYGKEVADFKSVDYDFLFTMNIAATQELARRVQALENGIPVYPAPDYQALREKNAAFAIQQAGFGKQLDELGKRLKRLENRALPPR